MLKLMTALAVFSLFNTAQALNVSPLHAIDRGDGKIEWMTPEEASLLGAQAHEDKRGDFHRCGGYFDLTDITPISNKASIPLVKWFTSTLADRPLTQGAYLKSALPLVDAAQLHKTVEKLSSFPNRFYKNQTGADSAQWIADQFKAIAINRNDVKVELFKHKNWLQPSVVVTVTGKTKPDEIIVLGGHEDSVNQGVFGPNASAGAPGADDNATGIATLIETFRVLVASNYQPERTIQFMAYAAEEVGLLGSQDLANTFKNQNKKVLAVVQFDMTGFPGAGNQIVFMTDFVNPELTVYAQKLTDTYVKAKWSTDKCGYACSDHASWTKAGYPSIMPFEATMQLDNKNIHTVKDKIELLDFNHSLSFARLALSFMAELSSD